VSFQGGENDIHFTQEQREPLLRTKLFIPPVRPKRVPRTHLIEKLHGSLDKALILISAPAGYGKTTLATSWLHETNLASAWLSLDEDDNDPLHFLLNFSAALQGAAPAHPLDLSSARQGIQLETYKPPLNLLINAFPEKTIPFVLVLDDFHVIQSQSVLEMLIFLLEHLPPNIHLLLLTRSDPPLPLARLRARNQLAEIRAEQLRFTMQEVGIFLNDVMGLRLSGDEVAAMERRTEGWIAGLHLAALSMQGRQDSHSFISAFTGSHTYIMDYLTEEVLKTQTNEVCSFLLQTSILSRMCGPLCEAVWDAGQAGVPNGQGMLESLEQRNLFVIPLDDQRHWYRYHHLFADMLNRRLERLFPGQIPDLHRRASLWYEHNGFLLEAIQHALLAGDQTRAAQLVEDHGCTLLMRGEGFTLLKCVDAVESFAQLHPWLAALRAWALELTGRFDEVEPALQKAESLIPSSEPTFEVRIMLGTIASVRAHLADLWGEASRAAMYAWEALKYLPTGNDFACSLRSVATSILGDASWMNGNLEAARQAYLEAKQIGRTAGNLYMELIINTNLADVLLEQGELHQATRIFTESLVTAAPPGGQKLPLASRFYAGLSEIAYERNHLDEAAAYLPPCIELCQQWGNDYLLAKSYLMLARLEQVRGNPAKAADALQAAEQIVRSQQFSPRQSVWLNESIGRYWIIQGSPERVVHLLQQVGLTSEFMKSQADIPYLKEPEMMLMVRLLLAQGEYEAALALTERLLLQVEAEKRNGRLIEIWILQALAWQGKKQTAQALAVLERALTLGQLDGYARIFLDEGEPMIKLLYQAKARQIGSGYASELLSAWGKNEDREVPPVQLLVKPLTMREVEVLKLIAAGESNQDIAEKLVISLPTVKRHISNIYMKLGATSRTQALLLGRELRLIS